MTPLELNIDNLYALYRNVLGQMGKHGALGKIEFPIGIEWVWPGFVFSCSWSNTVNELQHSLVAIRNKMIGQQCPPFLIVPKTESHHSLETVLSSLGFVPITVWYAMNNVLGQQAAETIQSVRVVQSENETTQWLEIVNRCLFSKKELNGELIRQMRGSGNVTLYLSDDGDQPVSACMIFNNSCATGIYMVSTLPEARGNGFAANIIRNVVQSQKKPLILQATLMSEKLYRRAGFEKVGELIIYWLKA